MDLSRSVFGDLAGGDVTAHRQLSDEAFLTAIVDFERALADAAEAVGVVSTPDADAARRTIDTFSIDVAEISAASAAGGNPAIPIAAGLKSLAKENGAGIAGIHVGATSQDAIDTALVLCVKRAGEAIIARAGDVVVLLSGLAGRHRSTPVMGRTLGQQALPTTFGVIAAGWAEGVHSAAGELRRAITALPVQYAGGTGNLVATHPRGIAVHDELATRLGLADRPLVWHTNRLPFTAVAVAAAQLAGAVRKVAGDIVAHSATEIGELREPAPGGSSSMPHKANPAASVACDGYARRAPGLAATLLDALDCRWQRGVGSWHSEWQTLRDLLAVTASAVSRLHAALDGIDVDTGAMAANMVRTGADPAGADAGHAEEIVDLVLAGLTAEFPTTHPREETTHDE